MTGEARCPRCAGDRLARHGERRVDVADVEGGRLRWGHARIARVMCRSCGRTSGIGETEVDARMALARDFACAILARHGMEAAVAAAGVTDRTLERWAHTTADERLSGPLPGLLLLAVSGKWALVLDAATGAPLDAAPADGPALHGLLEARGGDVEAAWTMPDLRLREAVERAFPGAEVRVPASVARRRLAGLLEAGGRTAETGLLAARVARSGWDADAVGSLHACHRRRGGPGDLLLTLWADALVAGLAAGDPARPSAPPEGPLARLRAWIAYPPDRDAGPCPREAAG